MGNRAIVLFRDKAWKNAVTGEQEYRVSPSVYLHWNGGPESVFAFLAETHRRIGGRRGDTSYESARFVQTIGDWLDQDGRESTSLGIANWPMKPVSVMGYGDRLMDAVVADLSETVIGRENPGDNGVYIIDSKEGTYEIHGGYSREVPRTGTLEEAYAALENHSYTEPIAKTFREFDEKLYGVSVTQ